MSIYAHDALNGKHALITGATGGIGQAVAKLLARMGAAVTLTGRNAERLAALQEAITQELPAAKVLTVTADLTSADDRLRLVSSAEQQHGPVTLLVNNAGQYQFATVEDVTEESLAGLMQANYTSAVLLTQLVYKGMKQLGSGAVVNVSSLSGLRGSYGNTAYAASKFALTGFTHSFAMEAIKHNVRVNAVCPGFVDTDMGYDVIRNISNVSGASFEQQVKKTNADIPSGRITTPEEVANTIAFLLTDAAANIVGESVKISGGALLR